MAQKKKKVMQLEVYSDGSVQVLDAIQSEAAGKNIKAKKTNWKEFHGYLRKNKEKESVSEKQATIILTNPCCWVKINNIWYVVCW